MDISRLSPFRGYHTSVFYLSSGHYFRISNWSTSPTEFGAFTNLWMVTPQEDRILFADPPASGRVVCIYHKFNQTLGAKLRFGWPRPNELHLDVESENGTQIELRLCLGMTLGTRIITATSRNTSRELLSTERMIHFGEKLGDLLVSKRGTKISGHTETGEPFFIGETERLLIIKEANVRLNGNSLGPLSRPTQPISFGDAIASSEPALVFGTLYLHYEMPSPT